MFKIYSNIKTRRKELGMSQSVLAERMGYADKGMISRIESGRIDLPYSKIIEFAKVLDMSPQSLMGWDDIEMPTTLSDRQKELLDLYANCDPEHQQSAALALKDGQLPVEPQS